MNRTIKFTIAFSLLIHLAFLWPWYSHAPQKPAPISQPKNQTVEITLTKTQPKITIAPTAEPKAEDKPPPPRHMEDDIEKANTSDGLAEKAGGNPTQAKQKGESEAKASKASSQKQLIASQKEAKRAEALKSIFGQETEVAGGAEESNEAKLNEVSDNELDNSLVKSPLSKAQEEKARWYNETLKRLKEQISYIYVKPEGVSKYAQGTIKFKLDQQGYLLTSWIDTPSGNWALDEAVLRAIKGVIRYQIPNSPRQYNFYKEITINYGGN